MTCKPSLSIITRTKNRPALLARAFESLLAQTTRDFAWIVVNDGTDAQSVETLVARAREALDHVVLVKPEGPSRGMEAAANRGVRAASTELITFLDDDDTFEPDFARRTTSLLAAEPALQAVCVQSHIVEEQGEPPVVVRKFVMNADLKAIHLADMTLFNHFTTNSLVYRRALHEEIGYFREDLPVMGDWEFGLRLVARYDVSVILEPLANYHRRIDRQDPASAAANTVVAMQDVHAATDARLRNEFLRRSAEAGVTAELLGAARIRLRADEMLRFRFQETQEVVRAATQEQQAAMAAMSDRLLRLEAALPDLAVNQDALLGAIEALSEKLSSLGAACSEIAAGQAAALEASSALGDRQNRLERLIDERVPLKGRVRRALRRWI